MEPTFRAIKKSAQKGISFISVSACFIFEGFKPDGTRRAIPSWNCKQTVICARDNVGTDDQFLIIPAVFPWTCAC